MYMSRTMFASVLLLASVLTANAAASAGIEEALGQDSQASPAPRANPNASGVYHVGDGVSAPQIVHSVNPEFTDEARKKKLGGFCVVGLLVDTTGKPQDVHVVTSTAAHMSPDLRSVAEGLDANAVKAAQQYRFKPATYQGKPVAVEIKVLMNFRVF
jgi:TonB family protein